MYGTLKNLQWYVLLLLVVATMFIWYAVIREDREGKLTVAFLNIGQGDAIFIESPTGNQVLVDGGPDRTVLSALRPLIPFYDRTIDLLIVSNPDKDHIAGFVDALRAYRVGAVVEPGTIGESAEYRALEEAISEEGAWRVVARRGQILDLGGGAVLEVLFPDRDARELETNTGSIVAKLSYGDTSVLLMGDAPESIERYLVEIDGKRLNTDLLKVGHHGSKTSTGDELLGFATPVAAIISAGRENRYGHPHPEVIERLARFGVPTLGTYDHGTIVFHSDGVRVWEEKIKHAKEDTIKIR